MSNASGPSVECADVIRGIILVGIASAVSVFLAVPVGEALLCCVGWIFGLGGAIAVVRTIDKFT